MQWLQANRFGILQVAFYKGIRHASKTTLRPYQEQCIQACIDSLQSGYTRIGVSLPTGSGKTTVFISLLSRISTPGENLHATRSLIVVNSVELARQSATQVSALFPEWSVEIEQGTRHHASGVADVTVATYQTLLQPQRIAKFNPYHLKAVIVDEAHHAAAPSYRRLLSRFDSHIRSPDHDFEPPTLPHRIPILGFSATFSRHDGLALGSVFERIVYHRDFLEMIKEQWLCDVRFTSVRAKLNLENVKISTTTGDFSPTSLAHVVNTETVNHLVVQTWLDRAATRRSTLVFCVNLKHVRALTQTFRDFGIDARYIYSKTPANERKVLISTFKAGEFPVLVNCAILTEGADIPNIDCVVVARPTRSRNVFAQMIGRGMRLSPETGKMDCRIIDFVDSFSRVSGVVSVPTLFGLDPETTDIDDETTEQLEQRVSEAILFDNNDNFLQPKSITYTDYDDPFSLVSHSSGAPSIAKLSSYAWVGCGDNVYVLECLGKGHIRVEPVKDEKDTEEQWRAYFTPAMLDRRTASTFKVSPYLRSRKVLTAGNLADAIRGCDTYARIKVVFGPMVAGLLHSARWRKEPATPQQKALLEKRWSKRKRNSVIMDDSPESQDGEAVTPADEISKLTKGEAANIITRLKHGAQARYDKKVREMQKTTKFQTKENARRTRELIQVGPLPQPSIRG